jgi:nicotinamide mononucleotide adenylyltransferase
MKVLIMGLPGSGKTTLARAVVRELNGRGEAAAHVNGDDVRRRYDDWSFTRAGRERQALRMARECSSYSHAIADFVCPTSDTLAVFEFQVPADLIVWMDTIQTSRFPDTDAMFQPPARCDVRVRTWAKGWAHRIAGLIVQGEKPPTWDNRAATVQLLGRYQPWHAGHQALFERAMEKTGQVCIMVRDAQGQGDGNPFSAAQVERNIHEALEVRFHGRYTVQIVPNIVEIVYGRVVGYRITQEDLGAAVHAISATEIRREMAL